MKEEAGRRPNYQLETGWRISKGRPAAGYRDETRGNSFEFIHLLNTKVNRKKRKEKRKEG
jgi:hypothetical protein